MAASTQGTNTKFTISFAGPIGCPRVGAFCRSLVDGRVVPRKIELVFQPDNGVENNNLRIVDGSSEESLYQAFVAAKERFGNRCALDEGSKSTVRGDTVQDTNNLLGEDRLPYRVGKNRGVLEMFLKEPFEQGRMGYPMFLKNLFASISRRPPTAGRINESIQ